MPYCIKCGVELQNNAEKCPLCRTPVPAQFITGDVQEKNYPVDRVVERTGPGMSKAQKKRLAMIIVTISLTIPLVLTLWIDFMNNKRITWSYYPVSGIILAWILCAMPLILKRHYWILYIIYAVAIEFFLFLLELIKLPGTWFFSLGIWLTISLWIIFGSVLAICYISRRKGVNIAAYILQGITVYSIVVDMIIKNFLNMKITPKWSIIVASVLILISILLLIIHSNTKLRFIITKKLHI